ncbi:MAG: alkaline phosphatase [Bacteroidota bacterium]
MRFTYDREASIYICPGGDFMSTFRMAIAVMLMLALPALLEVDSQQLVAQDRSADAQGGRSNLDRSPVGRTGPVIFIHPDGTGLNHWNAGRMYWAGPDGLLEWDQLPHMAIYRGHMTDRLTGTSNGGATVHAFGYKVQGPGSFGQDGGGREQAGRAIMALSGYPGSLMREAANAGHPVGVVNDGDAAEPGTGAFLAEVDDRGLSNDIVAQFLDGRPGFEGEARPVVVLGGGERFFLPTSAPRCEGALRPDCYAHIDPVNGRGPAREDGRNLIQEALDAGYEVLRTRAEFEALMARLEADERLAPRVLGLFAADDIFNDEPEEVIIDLGLTDPAMDPDGKDGDLILWGSVPGTFGYHPPTPGEMMDLALMILERHSAEVGRPFMLVAEVESTDNLANNTNGIGLLRAVRYADELIGVARDYVAQHPRTMIVTAADSDGGGPQVFSPAPTDAAGNVGVSRGNSAGREGERGFPLDGTRGQGTAPFIAEPDAFGRAHDFAIGYPGPNDVAGGIVSRAEGLNASLLNAFFNGQFDSTDVYRLMYLTLFGELLPSSQGLTAPDRTDASRSAGEEATGGGGR